MPRLPSSPALLLSKNARKVILALKQQQKSFATAEAAIEISLPPSSTPSSSSSNSAVNNSNVSTTIPMAKPPAQNKPVFPSSSSLPVIPSFAPVPVSLEVFYERVAMIHAFISTGDIFRAEIVFHRLFRSNKLELKRHADTRIFNAFIEGYLQSSVQCEIPKYQVARALEWFDRISAMGFAPTQETYAILLLHFCGKDDLEQVEKYVTMAQQASIDTLNILNDDRFIDSPAARSTLEVVLRKLDVDVDNYIPTDDFLLSVLDEKRIDLTVNSWSARQGDSSSSLVETDVSSASTTMLASSNSNSPAINRNAVIAYDSTSNDHAATSANKGGIGAATILDKKHMDIERNAQEFANIKKTKSLGVNLLARTLQKLAESHDIDAASKYKQQEWLEEESVRMANEQSTDNIAHDNIHFLNHMPKKLLQKWFAQIMPIIKTEIKNMKQSNYTSQAHVPFMKLLKPEQLTLIAISEFMKVPKKREIDTLGDVKAVSILVSIGKSVQSEANANYIKRKRNQKSIKMDQKIHALHASGELFKPDVRKVAMAAARKQYDSDKQRIWTPEWPTHMYAKVGAVIASMVIKLATISVSKEVISEDGSSKSIMVEEPAFYHVIESANGESIGKIKYHQKLLEAIMSSSSSFFVPRLLPMIVPPRPWQAPDNGGYLTHSRSQPLIRMHGNIYQAAMVDEADKKGYLHTIYHALDVLGATPWRVNRRLLDVCMQCWNEGSEWPSVPSIHVVPEVEPPAEKDLEDPKVKRSYSFAKKKRKDAEMARYSQRCETNYKILLAKAFENQTIYFPQYIDFRGRAYPLPVHLNHIGDDLCRGLLLFDEAKVLGERGLYWLKIQVANLYGKDKISFDERLQFVEENLTLVFDSADNPLTGQRWWLKAENPWQCLATCFELTEALRHPVPIAFKSRMPIHQDGTCNGLQHYAALGGDRLGAEQVNLVPSERPMDVYSGVAEDVAELVARDFEAGVPEAKILHGKITRKIVKQTVMTNTYGVTFIGAKQQVMNRLNEVKKEHQWTDEQVGLCAPYITRKIFDSLGQFFSGARAIQLWLNKTAKMIASSVPSADLDQQVLEDVKFLESIGVLAKSTPSPPAVSSSESDHHSTDVVESSSSSNEKSTSTVAFYSSTNSANDEFIDDHDADIQPPVQQLVASAQSEAVQISNATSSTPSSSSNPTPSPTAHNLKDELAVTVKLTDTVSEQGLDSHSQQKKSSGELLRMTSVTWTTPLGLPIVQPYRNERSKTYKTILQGISLVDQSSPASVDATKQSTAFPPNFIHSLDASHMMLSANECKNQGLQFAAVHDSYWTHPCDVDTMSSILRDAFVKLHKRSIMTDLKNEFEWRYIGYKLQETVVLTGQHLQQWNAHLKATGRSRGGSNLKQKKVVVWVDLKLPDLPARGDFDIEVIKSSKYFFH